MKSPYGVITHACPLATSSWVAGAAMVKCDPVQPSSSVVDTAVKCGANSSTFMGVSNEDKDINLPFGVNEAEYFVGLVGSGGITMGHKVKTDGAGGFILGESAHDYDVAVAMTTGAAGDYIEFKRLPVVAYRTS